MSAWGRVGMAMRVNGMIWGFRKSLRTVASRVLVEVAKDVNDLANR